MRGKPGKIAVVLFAVVGSVGALGWGGIHLVAAARARDALARLLAAHPELAVAAVEAEPFAGAVRLRGVTLRGAGSWRVSVGALRLPVAGLALPSPVGAAAAATPSPPPQPAATPVPVAGAGTASAENVVVVSGATTIRIRRIDMTGTALTSADLAALLDAKDTTTIEARLRRLTAAAIVMPEIVSDDATPGTERHASLAQVVLAGIAAGKVAAGSASAGSFAIKDADNAVNGTVGAVEATGIDLGQIAHVLGSTRASEAEPLLPLYESAVLDTVTINNVTRHAVLSIGSIRETGAKGRALKTDPATAIAAQRPAGDPRTAALLDDLEHSLAVGSLVLSDLTSRTDAPGGATEFGSLRTSVSGFGDGKVGGVDVRSFHFQGAKQGTVTIAAVVAGPMTLPGATADAAVPSAGTIDAAGIDVDLLGQADPDADGGDADDAPAGHTRFKVGHAVVTSDGAGRRIPSKSTVKVDDVSFDAAAEGGTGGLPLYDMGYRHLDLSGTLESTYDAATRDLRIGKLRVQGRDMGTLDLGLALGNVGEGVLSPDPKTAQAAMLAVVAKSIDVHLTNGGLLDKALAWKARKDGVSVEQERDTGVDFFTNGVPALLNDNPKVKALGAAVAGFIADPKVLDVAVASPGGVGVAALGLLATPDALIDGLDIRASNEP